MGDIIKTLTANIDLLHTSKEHGDFRDEVSAINEIYHTLTHLSKKQCKQLSRLSQKPKYRNHLLKVIRVHSDMTETTKEAILEALASDKS